MEIEIEIEIEIERYGKLGREIERDRQRERDRQIVQIGRQIERKRERGSEPQPPFWPSMHHNNSPLLQVFLSLKLPPLPCAVLLVEESRSGGMFEIHGQHRHNARAQPPITKAEEEETRHVKPSPATFSFSWKVVSTDYHLEWKMQGNCEKQP